MSRFKKISFIFKTFSLTTVVVIIFVFASFAHAQSQATASASPETEKVKVSFPIPELGNCADKKECKNFCEEPVNRDACTAFAKKVGIFRENRGRGNAVKKALMELAKQQLGCDSEDSCKALCRLPENFDKCSDIAKRLNLQSENQQASLISVLEKAKEFLGCDSLSSCKEVCSNPDNADKCSEFAHRVNLRGGIKKTEQEHGIENENEDEDEREGFESGRPANRAFERANENAKFCRENPGKCVRNLSSPTGSLNKNATEKDFEIKKKEEELRRKEEKLKQQEDFKVEEFNKEISEDVELRKLENESLSGGDDDNSGEGSEGDDDGSEVKGASTNIFQQIFRFFFK